MLQRCTRKSIAWAPPLRRCPRKRIAWAPSLWALSLTACLVLGAVARPAAAMVGRSACTGSGALHHCRVVLELQQSAPDNAVQRAQWHALTHKLCRYLHLPEGPLSDAELQRSATALSTLDYFVDAQCRRHGRGLHCVLQPQPLVVKSDVRGPLPLSMLRSDLRRRVFLRPGMPLVNLPAELQRQRERLVAYLNSEGYLDAEVTVRALQTAGGWPNQGVDIDVEVQVGQASTLGELTLHGSPFIPAADMAATAPAAATTPAAAPVPAAVTAAAPAPSSASAASDKQLRRIFRHTGLFFLGAKPFRPAQLSDDIDSAVQMLHDAGFPSATVLARHVRRPQAHKVDLIVDVRPGPRLSLEFVGNTALSSRSLEKLATFAQQGALDAIEIENTRQAIATAYERKGYDACDVRSDVERLGAQHTRVRYTLEEGPRHRLTAVQLTGNTLATQEQLMARAQLLSRASGLWARRYISEYVTHDVAALIHYYRSQGFNDVQVQASKSLRCDETSAPEAAQGTAPPNCDSLTLTFAIQEGPQQRVAQVNLEGYPGDAEAAAKVRTSLALQPGSPVDLTHLDTDADAVRTSLASAGYLHAKVETDSRVEADGWHLDHRVTPQARAQAGEVFLVGNLRTVTNVVAQELTVQPKQPLDIVALGHMRRRLRGLNIFTDVQLKPLLRNQTDTPATQHAGNGDPQPSVPADVWLALSVQEREVQSLDAVLAFSTDDQFSVGADFRDANAFGHAIAINGQLRLSDASEVVPRVRIGNMDSLSLRLRAPRPWRLPADVETTAFYQFLDYSVFRSRLAGGSAALLRTLVERSDCAFCPQLQGRLAYELTQGYLHIKGDATNVVLPHSAPRNLPSATIARLVPSLSLDGRDQVLDPHRGYAATSRFEIGIPRLAGPLHREAASFWRILLATQGYLPLGRPILALLESGKALGGDLLLATSLSYSIAGPLGAGGRVPDSETFYYGGDFSVRGLSTRASQAARLATAMLTASMELRWYLYEVGFGTFALAGFVDLGTVAQRTFKLLQETTVTVGPVLRYVTFVGPISLGYGWPLHRAAALLARPDLAPPHGRLHFTFGYSF